MSSKKPLETTTKSSPGAMLQRAREKSGMSLQQISEQTLIAVSRLQALESDDFKRVGEPPYVIGYARNAAVAIGVDPQPIVDAYTSALDDIQTKLAIYKAENTPVAASRAPNQVKMLIYVVGATLACVLLLFAYLLLNKDKASLSTQTKQNTARTIETGANYQQEPEAARSEMVEPSQSREAQLDEVILSEETVEVVETIPEVADQQNADDPQVMPESANDSNDGDQVVDESQSELSEQASENRIDSLDLIFTDECWVQITDASGKRLVAMVANGGDHVNASGVAPFDVLLGNARATALELNGKPIAFEPRPGKRTLRLTVDD